MHSGQICMSTERVIVEKSAESQVLEKLKALYSKIKAGDPSTDPSHRLGALFTEQSAKNFIASIEESQKQGARLVLGDLKREGHVVQPHILADVKPGMPAFDRESFGPGTSVSFNCRWGLILLLSRVCDDLRDRG